LQLIKINETCEAISCRHKYNLKCCSCSFKNIHKNAEEICVDKWAKMWEMRLFRNVATFTAKNYISMNSCLGNKNYKSFIFEVDSLMIMGTVDFKFKWLCNLNILNRLKYYF